MRLRIARCDRSLWRRFAAHHYLAGGLHPGAACYAATQGGRPVAFCATLQNAGWRGRDRVTRIVVLPRWRGRGVAARLLRAVALDRRSRGRRLSLVTSNPAMVAALQASDDWQLKYRRPRGNDKRDLPDGGRSGSSRGRGVHSFEFVGADAPVA